MEQPRRNDFDTMNRKFLLSQGFTDGLVDALHDNRVKIKLAIWILDNSATMLANDGHRMLQDSVKCRFLKCSRWHEMAETALVHICLAASIGAPTTFRLLNHPGHNVGPQIFSVAMSPEATQENDVAVARSTIQNTKAQGATPLTEHIRAIRNIVEPMNADLRRQGKKVAIVIATDGLPTDQYGESNMNANELFKAEIRALRALEVLLVVRLCTDEKAVIDYWNNSDNILEIDLDVLDDYVSEAKEVYAKNPWLNYGLPLHHVREMGFDARVLDRLDETPLSKDDMCDFLRILFGNVDLPDPDTHWKSFCQQVSEYLSRERMQYNPIHRKMMPWIDMKKLRRLYQPSWFR